MVLPTKEVDGWVNYVEISDDNSVDPVVTTDIDSAPGATKQMMLLVVETTSVTSLQELVLIEIE
ncbi:MAG: hypothetical protein IPO26_14010 [Saprospiraceae bacterium]|nr:hypothetical protein [Saprospiraceae bacterium]